MPRVTLHPAPFDGPVAAREARSMASGARDPDAGRIDHPPAVSDRARLPEALGRRFVVFVDTEEEFDWAAPLHRESVAVTALAALPDMHARLRAAGVVPVYLVDYPVAASPLAAEMLGGWQSEGAAEIGAQLHPWVNPPFEEPVTPANSFLGNLPEALERAKIAALTGRIATAFGRRPIVFRAGRYGVGRNSARLLEEAGYRLDTSVRALFDYRREGGPDFSRRDCGPYWAGPSRLLLELPLSSVFIGRARAMGHGLYRGTARVPRLRGLLARSGLLARVPLTPEGTPLRDALDAIRALLADGARLLSISFHSPSVQPGHTPYVRDAADLRVFHAWWDGVLDLLAREGVQPIGAEALVEAAWRARDVGLKLATR